MFRKILPFILTYIYIQSALIAQSSPNLIREGAPNVYLDCRCDRSYIKEMIPVVNYVADQRNADIHILFTDQRTGSGGREYSLLFNGLNQFEGTDDTVKYSTNQTETEEKTRIKMVDALKAGLVKYIYNSKIAGQMKIQYDNNAAGLDVTQQIDDWDFWVFRTSVRTSLGGQQTSSNNNFEGSFSLNRVTEESKINFYLSGQYSESIYNYDDEKIKSISRNQNASGSYLKAIDNHWSWGVWSSAGKSNWSNIELGLNVSSGIEYNFFPYTEANQRQFSFQYRINSRFNKYGEETIYLKKEEYLLSQSMHIYLELIETWGNIGIGLNASNYLHDFDLYSLGANGFVSWKVAKGFSLDLRGNYSKINNQIALPRGDASLEDVLLRRREIQTQYSYNFSIGFSYTFGSIYNNAVNPRFDGN